MNNQQAAQKLQQEEAVQMARPALHHTHWKHWMDTDKHEVCIAVFFQWSTAGGPAQAPSPICLDSIWSGG